MRLCLCMGWYSFYVKTFNVIHQQGPMTFLLQSQHLHSYAIRISGEMFIIFHGLLVLLSSSPRLFLLNTHINTDLVSIFHRCQIVRSMHAWSWPSVCICVGACARVRVLDTLTQGEIRSTKNSHISFVF